MEEAKRDATDLRSTLNTEPMFHSTDVTLYVPYYNSAATIADCLDGVRRQTASPGRLIVVDGGSDPPFDESFLDDFPNARLLRQNENKGLANARNVARKLCRTPLIAALDADVVPEETWLERLLDDFANHDVDGIGGRLDERHQVDLGDRWRAVHMAQHWGDESVDEPRFLYGANTLFKKDALDAIGGYDERLATNHEDADASERLRSAGYSLRYQPTARCFHLRRDTAASILPGFWKWHHAKGVISGEFDASDGLIDRIERVNFGIFRYRFDLDRDAGRYDFLELDALIPWVFCVLDLKFAVTERGVPVPEFPGPELMKRLNLQHRQSFLDTVEPVIPGNEEPPWGDEYRKRFEQALKTWKWDGEP